MNDEHLLELLLYELAFLKLGGYGSPWRSSWRPTMIFRDSPVCIHKTPEVKCNECALTNFVPEDQKSKNIPCHHIPLNDRGDTVESLYQTADQSRLDEVLRAWLEATISRLRGEQLQKKTVDEESADEP